MVLDLGLDVGGQHAALHQIVEVLELGLGALLDDLLGAGLADALELLQLGGAGGVDVDLLGLGLSRGGRSRN